MKQKEGSHFVIMYEGKILFFLFKVMFMLHCFIRDKAMATYEAFQMLSSI